MRRAKPENEYFITDSKSVASLNLLVNYLFKPLLINFIVKLKFHT